MLGEYKKTSFRNSLMGYGNFTVLSIVSLAEKLYNKDVYQIIQDPCYLCLDYKCW